MLRPLWRVDLLCYLCKPELTQAIACYTMDTEAADFQRSGYLSSEQAELLRSKVDELLAVIRPQAVPLVDSFKLPDYLLNSALGRDDGEVYRALFDFAIRERRFSQPARTAACLTRNLASSAALNGSRFNVDYRSSELGIGEDSPPSSRL